MRSDFKKAYWTHQYKDNCQRQKETIQVRDHETASLQCQLPEVSYPWGKQGEKTAEVHKECFGMEEMLCILIRMVVTCLPMSNLSHCIFKVLFIIYKFYPNKIKNNRGNTEICNLINRKYISIHKKLIF